MVEDSARNQRGGMSMGRTVPIARLAAFGFSERSAATYSHVSERSETEFQRKTLQAITPHSSTNDFRLPLAFAPRT